jgi:hypothetical protein
VDNYTERRYPKDTLKNTRENANGDTLWKTFLEDIFSKALQRCLSRVSGEKGGGGSSLKFPLVSTRVSSRVYIMLFPGMSSRVTPRASSRISSRVPPRVPPQSVLLRRTPWLTFSGALQGILQGVL